MSDQTVAYLMRFSHDLAWIPLAAMVAIWCLAFLVNALRRRNGDEPVRLLSSLGAAFTLLWLYTLLHPYCATFASRRTACLMAIKNSTQAQLAYANDNDDHLADSLDWGRRVANYRKDEWVTCPGARLDGKASYALNRALGRFHFDQVENASETVLLFESDAGGLGGPDDMARDRHGKRPNFGFLDGHAKAARSDQWQPVLWTPVLTK